VQANITQTVSANDYVLQISGTQTGAANAVSVNVGANSHSLASSVSTAQDAVATIGGVTVNRSSNKISDVVNGITFNLVGQSTGSSAATVTVQQGADNSSAMINTLIKAYNDVVTQYNTYTANANSGSSTATTNGDFATDPTMLSFVNNIKSMFAYGATDTTSATIAGYGSASSAANIDTTSGYLKINGTKYNFSSIGQSNPTVSQFVSWVNGLGAGVTASFDGANIQINNSQTGGSNSIDLSGVSNSVKRTTISLASMGMDIQLDGTIQFNTATYQQAATNGLASKLAKGLKMGFSGGGSSLDAFLVSEIDPAKGALVTQISNQQSSVTDLQKRQAELQDHLNQIQNNYITQYSALNALLFQLNSTSTSLTSALTAITNINAGK
jgi:flagellar hook-associated protein 2